MKHLQQLIRYLPSDAHYDEFDSPVGVLTLITSEKGLHRILWDIDRKHSQCNQIIKALNHSPNSELMMNIKKQLSEYFAGTRKIFNLPLAPEGTSFQQQAWKALCTIPYGETISYGEQAQRLGDKNKARAVGLANGANPISIIVPCHRVIGSNGKLTGFGGGLDKKSWLLVHEAKNLKP